MKFSTEEEAIEMANDSIYGLAAAVFTSKFVFDSSRSSLFHEILHVTSRRRCQTVDASNGRTRGGNGLGESIRSVCLVLLLVLPRLLTRHALIGILHSSVPFGGMRQSGIGRELGRAGIYEYCNVKSVHHNISEEM